MRRSKSCEDIRIHIGYSYDQTDVKCNFIVTNFIKSKPCQRYLDEDANQNAYILASKMKNQEIQSCYLKQFQPVKRKRRTQKRHVSQDQFEKLVLLQDQIQTQALHSLCTQVPMKSRVSIPLTPKQLAKADFNTLASRVKRSQMVKKVMNKACPQNKRCIQPKNSLTAANESSQSLQSISGKTFETVRSSFAEQTQQHKNKMKKKAYFENKLKTMEYDQVLNTERRKQAWKGFMQAQRNRTKQLMTAKNPNAQITFVNIPTSKNKRCPKVTGMNNEQVLGSNFMMLQNLKSLHSGLEAVSSQYKLATK